MIFKASPHLRGSFPLSRSFLPSPNPKSRSSLPWQSDFASIGFDFRISSNIVADGPSFQLCSSRNVNKAGFVCQAHQTVETRIAGASSTRSVIRSSPMSGAIGSASFYPIRGLYFFFQPENRVLLWKRIAKFTAELSCAAAAVVGTIWGFTFHLQRGLVLQLLPHSLHVLGTPGTIAVILIEAAIPLVGIFYNRIRRVQEKLFVDVLHIQGIHPEVTPTEEREWIDQQRRIQSRQQRSRFKALADPAALNNRPIMKYFVTLPLNCIPVAGQAAFCWLNSMDISTMLHHYYYYKLKRLTPEEETTIIYFRRKQYQQFGLVATGLTLFPGPNILFLLTNSVGAALWAADIERAMHKRH